MKRFAPTNNMEINSLLDGLTTVYPQLYGAIEEPSWLSAAAVEMRSGEATIDLLDTAITSTGNVSISTDVGVDSTAEASGGVDPVKASSFAGGSPFAAGYSRANGTAETTLDGQTTIIATGDVSVLSNTETSTTVSAATEFNAAKPAKKRGGGKAELNPKLAFGISVAYTESTTVSTATVSQDVNISAGGTVTVDAEGTVASSAIAGVTIFLDGSGGIGVGVGSNTTSIQAGWMAILLRSAT